VRVTDDDATIPVGGPPPAGDSERPGETAPAGDTDRSSDTGPGGGTGPGGSPPGRTGFSAERADPARRRRRRLIRFGVAGAAMLILLVCAGAGAVAAGVNRLAHNADQARENRSRADAGCADLERRLNRLAPPGSATNPAQRAAAIRAENVALRPFLGELDSQGNRRRGGGPDRDRQGPDHPSLAAAWHQLVDARTGYADALDRQAAGREPAFFVAPKDRRGLPLFDRLDDSPRSCDGVARRLTTPDL
jgi:hypothetical protein